MYNYRLYSGTEKGNKNIENQDGLISKVIDWPKPMGNIYLVGVADGVSKTPFGGSVANWLSNSFNNDTIFLAQMGTLSEQFLKYLGLLHELFLFDYENSTDMCRSASTLSIAAIQGSYAECFWVGDSPIYLTAGSSSNRKTKLINSLDLDGNNQLTSVFSGLAFRPKHRQVRLEKDDVLTIATDGLRLNKNQINHTYMEQGINTKTIDDMIDFSKGFKKSDDCTISIAHRVD